MVKTKFLLANLSFPLKKFVATLCRHFLVWWGVPLLTLWYVAYGLFLYFGIGRKASESKRQSFLNIPIRLWARDLLRIAGVEVEVQGLHHLQKDSTQDQPVLLLFNHLSLYDIPVLHWAIPKSFRFGAKAELFNIPCLSLGMKIAGVLPIPRQNVKKAIRIFDQAKIRLQKGESFALAPEGSRQRFPFLAPFKSGPFILAINAQVPLVPIVLLGTEKVIPKKSLIINQGRWKQKVHLMVLPPIETRGWKIEHREELKSLVYQKMAEGLAELKEDGQSLSSDSEDLPIAQF